jgi:hypothetical protein
MAAASAASLPPASWRGARALTLATASIRACRPRSLGGGRSCRLIKEEPGLLDSVDLIAGTSSGAVIGTLRVISDCHF